MEVWKNVENLPLTCESLLTSLNLCQILYLLFLSTQGLNALTLHITPMPEVQPPFQLVMN